MIRRWLRNRRPCRCGHRRDAHTHYRLGIECSLCPCATYLEVRRCF